MADAMVTARMSSEKKRGGQPHTRADGHERLASGEPSVRLRDREARAAVFDREERRHYTQEEIAEAMGISVEKVREIIKIAQEPVSLETPIGEDETAGELFDRLMVLGAELLVDTIDKLDTITPQPQNDAEAIHAPMIRKEMGAIDWTQPAERVHDLVRGLNPWPSAFFTIEGKRMKLHRTKVVVGKGEPGEIAVIGGEMAVCCGENAVQLMEIQPENGKRMRGSDYLRGHAIEAKAKVQ